VNAVKRTTSLSRSSRPFVVLCDFNTAAAAATVRMFDAVRTFSVCIFFLCFYLIMREFLLNLKFSTDAEK